MSRVRLPPPRPFFAKKMVNEDASLLFTARSATSLKNEVFLHIFTELPGSLVGEVFSLFIKPVKYGPLRTSTDDYGQVGRFALLDLRIFFCGAAGDF